MVPRPSRLKDTRERPPRYLRYGDGPWVAEIEYSILSANEFRIDLVGIESLAVQLAVWELEGQAVEGHQARPPKRDNY